jgi:hypothetical protein
MRQNFSPNGRLDGRRTVPDSSRSSEDTAVGNARQTSATTLRFLAARRRKFATGICRRDSGELQGSSVSAALLERNVYAERRLPTLIFSSHSPPPPVLFCFTRSVSRIDFSLVYAHSWVVTPSSVLCEP